MCAGELLPTLGEVHVAALLVDKDIWIPQAHTYAGELQLQDPTISELTNKLVGQPLLAA
jgi:hypothetical protein